jgi:hypothetical protein
MRLTATIEAETLAPGIWQADLAGSELTQKAGLVRRGLPTILIVRDAAHHQGELSFDFRGLEILSRGDDARALILEPLQDTPATDSAMHADISGDEEFQSLLAPLAPVTQTLGRDLLERIREIDPDGELERRGRRFINRPDNFVALEPQTRLNQIIVHLRGDVSAKLQPVRSLNGYSAFKVTSEDDLLEIGSALGRAKRKF